MLSQYKSGDTRCLTEAYSQVNEGVWDRLKARTSQAGGAIGGAMSGIGGVAKGAYAGATGDVAGVNAATSQRNLAANQSEISKLTSYQSSLTQKLDNLKAEILNDLSSLNIASKDFNINDLTTLLSADITNAVGHVNVAFDKRVKALSTATPPPLPVAAKPLPVAGTETAAPDPKAVAPATPPPLPVATPTDKLNSDIAALDALNKANPEQAGKPLTPAKTKPGKRVQVNPRQVGEPFVSEKPRTRRPRNRKPRKPVKLRTTNAVPKAQRLNKMDVDPAAPRGGKPRAGARLILPRAPGK